MDRESALSPVLPHRGRGTTPPGPAGGPTHKRLQLNLYDGRTGSAFLLLGLVIPPDVGVRGEHLPQRLPQDPHAVAVDYPDPRGANQHRRIEKFVDAVTGFVGRGADDVDLGDRLAARAGLDGQRPSPGD